MSKKTIIIVAIVLVVFIGSAVFWMEESRKEYSSIPDPKNCTYGIEGNNIALANGYAEEEIAPGSASKMITEYFGNEAFGDFNGDGFNDIAFLLTQDSGGSGTFYYLAVALGGNKCSGTNAIFLGDRIAPQMTEFKNGEIVVNYAKREPDAPMTTTPSVGVSRYFKISDGELTEAVKD